MFKFSSRRVAFLDEYTTIKVGVIEEGTVSCLTIVAAALLNFSMIDFFAVKVFVPVDAKGESVELLVNLNWTVENGSAKGRGEKSRE